MRFFVADVSEDEFEDEEYISFSYSSSSEDDVGAEKEYADPSS